jgi:Ca2+-binding RTX toxin-like protein
MALIIGTSSADTTSGTDNNDTIRVLGGDDVAFGGLGNDRVEGGGGQDDLSGDEGVDTILGGPGNDELSGGAGNDQLSGGTGDDKLVGGLDNDALRGGDGRDIFAINPGDGDDTVRDFTKGSDIILLAGFRDFEDFVQVQAQLQQSGDDTLLQLNQDQGVRISNTQMADLDAGDFTLDPVQIQHHHVDLFLA